MDELQTLDVPALNRLGTYYFAEHQFSEAAAAYQAAIKKQATFLDAHYNLGLTWMKLGRDTDALTAFQNLLSLSNEYWPAHFQAATLLMKLQHYEVALAHLLLIERQGITHFETKVNLATCYLQLQKQDQAKEKYLQALDLVPTDTQVLFNLGLISAASGRYREAIDFYTQVIKCSPNDFATHNNLAVIYLELKDKEQALLHFREAKRLQPDNLAIEHNIDSLTEQNKHASPLQYIRSLFDAYAPHYETHLQQGLHYQLPKLFYDTLLKLNFKKKALTVLDLGCGTGLCGEYFKPVANWLVGVDLSKEMLIRADHKKIYDELIEADIHEYVSRTSQQFDLILAADVLVYSGELKNLFAAISCILNQDGLLMFSIELSEQANYQLMSSGRFTHSQQYIEQIAQECNYVMLTCEQHLLRTQAEKPVMGGVYVLTRCIAPHISWDKS